jgi:hypothetical protein
MRIRDALRIRFWLLLERLAKWVLGHSWRHVTPADRPRRAVHSEAYKRCVIVRCRAWISTADRN